LKRVGNLYHKISSYENLCAAFLKAAKGKRDRRDVFAFQNDFARNVDKIRRQLLRREPDIGHYHFFKVFDPKQRSICAASFPERVLHHAIMNVCEPVFESYAVYDSYACRKGKGNRRALKRAQHFARQYSWYLKLDVRKYFDSVDHAVVMKQLSRRIKDKDLLSLFRKLLDTFHTDKGKGLPIGNLISQNLANFYLGSFDHWIKETRRVRGYLRYMDDFLVFGENREALKTELTDIRFFLSKELALRLKTNIQLNRCIHGIPFLGYRVFPQTIRLSQRSRRRFVKKFIQYEGLWTSALWSTRTLARHVEPLIDFTRAAAADGFRRDIIARFGVPS
jgi:hypothetical protein